MYLLIDGRQVDHGTRPTPQLAGDGLGGQRLAGATLAVEQRRQPQPPLAALGEAEVGRHHRALPRMRDQPLQLCLLERRQMHILERHARLYPARDAGKLGAGALHAVQPGADDRDVDASSVRVALVPGDGAGAPRRVVQLRGTDPELSGEAHHLRGCWHCPRDGQHLLPSPTPLHFGWRLDDDEGRVEVGDRLPHVKQAGAGDRRKNARPLRAHIRFAVCAGEWLVAFDLADEEDDWLQQRLA